MPESLKNLIYHDPVEEEILQKEPEQKPEIIQPEPPKKKVEVFTESYSKLLRVRLLFILFAIYIAIAGEVLFIGDYFLGIGFFLFTILYTVGFTVIAKITGQLRNYWALFLALPLVIFGLSSFLYTNTLSSNWSPLFVFILIIVYPLFLTLQNPNKYRFSISHIPFVRNVFLPFTKIRYVFRDFKKLFGFKISPKYKGTVSKVLKGVFISIPILLVFGVLFYRADAIFADFVEKFFSHLHIDFTVEQIRSFIRVFILSVALSALYYIFLSKDHILGQKNEKAFKIDEVVGSVILGAVNLLFAVFVFIQFAYLFGKQEYVLANDMVFSEYARGGFFQLVAVIVLSAIMLLIFYRSSVFHKSKQIINWLQVALILQVIVIAVSALHRMNIYQDVYGFTVLRLYVEWFIYFSSIVLITALVSVIVKLKFRYFFYISICLGLSALTLISLTNVHYVIAKENVSRFLLQDTSLDTEYLYSLSYDAVPALEPLFIPENFEKLNIQNKLDLADILDSYKDIYFYDNDYPVVSFNYGRYKAWKIINKYDIKEINKKFEEAREIERLFLNNESSLNFDKKGSGCASSDITNKYKDQSVSCVLKKEGTKVIAFVAVNLGGGYLNDIEYAVYGKDLGAENYQLLKQYDFEYKGFKVVKEARRDNYDDFGWGNNSRKVEVSRPLNDFIFLKDGSFVEVDNENKTIDIYNIDIKNDFELKKTL